MDILKFNEYIYTPVQLFLIPLRVRVELYMQLHTAVQEPSVYFFVNLFGILAEFENFGGSHVP